MFRRLLTGIGRIRYIGAYLKDSSVSKIKKSAVIFGIIYLLSPLDLLSDPIFGIGLADDLLLWVFLLWYLSDELEQYRGQGMSKQARKEFRGKNIIEAEAVVLEEEQPASNRPQSKGEAKQ